jgi:hypothetical protein
MVSLSIVREGNEAAREGRKLDYLPFGVKTLKVAVDGDYQGMLRLAPVRRSSVRGETLGHEDGDGPPQFVVSWGGGYASYYRLNYPKQRIAHFLVQHVGDALDDRVLTIQAEAGSGEILTDLPITLTYPTKGGVPWPAADELVKPAWKEASRGLAGESDISLAGCYAPDYISRWWPRNRVVYDDSGAAPPQVRVRYRRRVDGDDGDLTVYATGSPGGAEVLLAKIQGQITYHMYDMQQVVPELYRFGSQTWALRVWFFWLDKKISLEDLSRYGTRTPDEIRLARQGLLSTTEGGTAAESWPGGHEIPDAERVDIVFSRELVPLYAATDLHWREMWGPLAKDATTVAARIVNTRPAGRSTEWKGLRKLANGWVTILRSEVLPERDWSKPYNPEVEVASELAGQGKLAADRRATQSHTPAILNIAMQMRFTSTDVRAG